MSMTTWLISGMRCRERNDDNGLWRTDGMRPQQHERAGEARGGADTTLAHAMCACGAVGERAEIE